MQSQPGTPDEKDKNYKAPPSKALAETGYTPGGSPGEMKKANQEKYVAIPSEFAKAETTKLSYTFAGGTQTHNVEMN